MKYKRIVFKVGTSSITRSDGSLSRGKIQTITRQLAALHHAGHELVLVSSGAVAAGFGALGFKKRPVKIADKQASAAVGQGLLMEEYTANLSSDGIVSAQILLSRADFADKRRYQNAGGALSVLLQRRAIPIINENDTVSVEELKIGDNDTLSAQVAAMIQADVYLFLTQTRFIGRSRRTSGGRLVFRPPCQRFADTEAMAGVLFRKPGQRLCGRRCGTRFVRTREKPADVGHCRNRRAFFPYGHRNRVQQGNQTAPGQRARPFRLRRRRRPAQIA